MLVLVVLSFMAKTFFAPLSNATQVVSAANTGETRSEWVKSVMAQGQQQFAIRNSQFAIEEGFAPGKNS